MGSCVYEYQRIYNHPLQPIIYRASRHIINMSHRDDDGDLWSFPNVSAAKIST